MNEKYGYEIWADQVRAEECGVAQWRPRFFMIGVRKDLMNRSNEGFDPFQMLQQLRPEFLQDKGLDAEHRVTVSQAISDLEVTGRELEPYPDNPRFRRLKYTHPQTPYQQMLHSPLNGETPDSLRLPNHRTATVQRYERIIEECRRGVGLTDQEKERLGLKKHSLVLLSPYQPAHTLTTLPDDFIHYSEPRILTVREMARLQSFPDWFEFRGKYTTGGPRRTEEAPRYTQVGNAVPPFVAELFGRVIDQMDNIFGEE